MVLTNHKRTDKKSMDCTKMQANDGGKIINGKHMDGLIMILL